jgi:ABC-type nickel/cobalt efflux system permease component RcnA
MAAIGAVLILRGGRALLAAATPAPALAGVPHGHGPDHHDHHHAHDHVHGPDCGCGHRHAPTPEEVANVHSLRDALALIAGVAIRPCTGALILLVIAWRADLVWAGFAAVVAMGLGTASFVTAVAVSAVAARNAALFAGRGARVGAALQIAAGVLIAAGAGAVLAGTLAA